MIFKAITGSSGYAFWWERTALHSMETVVWRLLGSLRKYQSRTTYLLRYAKVPYVTQQRELSKAASQRLPLRFFCIYRPYSAALSFPPRGVTGTSCYCFEYNLHLIKIPSHLNRESIYIGLLFINRTLLFIYWTPMHTAMALWLIWPPILKCSYLPAKIHDTS